LTVSQQCALVARKANGTLGFTVQSMASRAQCWAPQFQADWELLGEPSGECRDGRGLEHLACEERLRDVGLFSLEKTERGSYQCL